MKKKKKIKKVTASCNTNMVEEEEEEEIRKTHVLGSEFSKFLVLSITNFLSRRRKNLEEEIRKTLFLDFLKKINPIKAKIYKKSCWKMHDACVCLEAPALRSTEHASKN